MSKLQFQQNYPDGVNAFTGWPSLPTAVSREEAAWGLRRARRLARVVREGAHHYRLIGLNTVILQPALPAVR